MGICCADDTPRQFAFADAIIIQRTKDSQALQALAPLAPHVEFFLMIAAIAACVWIAFLAMGEGRKPLS